MEPTNIRFAGGATATILHPLVAMAVVLVIVVTCFAPRRHVLAPWLSTALLVPFGQVLVVGGVHFTVYRLIVLFGLVRLTTDAVLSGGARRSTFRSIDRAFTLCALFTFAAVSLQWMELPAVVKSVASLLDTLGGYFILRLLIRDRDTVRKAIKVMAVVAMVLSITMTAEQLSHTNVFGLLGGMPVEVVLRDGKPRSTGAFSVYLNAGAFGATLVPLLIWLWSDAKARLTAMFGVIGATIMTLTANSSTPLVVYASGVLALCLWPLRRQMRVLRWGLVIVLTGVHIFMTAPVWALIARIDLTGSSTGFHRYMLVDQCIRHLGEWWLMGVRNYNDWGYDMWDLSNQYVSYAVSGGMGALCFFILTISRSFGRLGIARKHFQGKLKREWLIWCIGAALLSNVVAYFGTSYWDQMQVAWYALLAIIVVVSSESDAPISQALRMRSVARHADAGMHIGLPGPPLVESHQ